MDYSDLIRYPIRKNESLQAWNAADELIVEYSKTLNLLNKRVLVINDFFGAISCYLNVIDLTTYTDSYVSSKSIEINSDNQVKPINDLDLLEGKYDFVFIQIPKNLNYFEDILQHVNDHSHDQSQIVFGAMIKHLSKKAFSLIELNLGQLSTSLAKKKARLIFAKNQLSLRKNKYPQDIYLEDINKNIRVESNVFSGSKLDIGTRYFFDFIPEGEFDKILDIGCGNGLIGVKASELHPKATVIFTDESAMAIKSAEYNFRTLSTNQAEFYWTNCYEDGDDDTIDLVLCNPPFHQNHTIGTHIAEGMFKNAKRVLKQGGIMRVIGNRHLKYHLALKRIFGSSQIVSSNKKFMIIESMKK